MVDTESRKHLLCHVDIKNWKQNMCNISINMFAAPWQMICLLFRGGLLLYAVECYDQWNIKKCATGTNIDEDITTYGLTCARASDCVHYMLGTENKKGFGVLFFSAQSFSGNWQQLVQWQCGKKLSGSWTKMSSITVILWALFCDKTTALNNTPF